MILIGRQTLRALRGLGPLDGTEVLSEMDTILTPVIWRPLIDGCRNTNTDTSFAIQLVEKTLFLAADYARCAATKVVLML